MWEWSITSQQKLPDRYNITPKEYNNIFFKEPNPCSEVDINIVLQKPREKKTDIHPQINKTYIHLPPRASTIGANLWALQLNMLYF